MTTKRLTPIEAMIDQATGFRPIRLARLVDVTMRCPACGKTKTAQRHRSDPPNTAIVEAPCLDCDDGSKFEVGYFNEAGQQIDCDAGEPL